MKWLETLVVVKILAVKHFSVAHYMKPYRQSFVMHNQNKIQRFMNSWMWKVKLKYKEKLSSECLHYSKIYFRGSKYEQSFHRRAATVFSFIYQECMWGQDHLSSSNFSYVKKKWVIVSKENKSLKIKCFHKRLQIQWLEPSILWSTVWKLLKDQLCRFMMLLKRDVRTKNVGSQYWVEKCSLNCIPPGGTGN